MASIMDLFRDVIKGILSNNRDLFDDPEAEKTYTPFIVNRALSYYTDTIFHANQMNQMHQLDKHCQINYFLNTIGTTKRPFVPWAKSVKDGDLQAVKTYYGYSDQRALDALQILTDEQITAIKQKINTGE